MTNIIPYLISEKNEFSKYTFMFGAIYERDSLDLGFDKDGNALSLTIEYQYEEVNRHLFFLRTMISRYYSLKDIQTSLNTMLKYDNTKELLKENFSISNATSIEVIGYNDPTLNSGNGFKSATMDKTSKKLILSKEIMSGSLTQEQLARVFYNTNKNMKTFKLVEDDCSLQIKVHYQKELQAKNGYVNASKILRLNLNQLALEQESRGSVY